MKEKFKKLKPYVIGMTIGLFLVSSGVIADTIIDSPNVSYENTSVKNALDELYELADLKDEIEELKQTIDNQWEKIYPVGSIYTSVSSTSPATLFGGTWVSFGAGRTLVGVGTGTDSNNETKTFTVNSTGGEYTHTLTENELPNISGNLHFHGQQADGSGWGVVSNAYGHFTVQTQQNRYANSGTLAVTSAKSYGMATFEFGNDESHNNIQPYITVYMWKRTA